MVSFKTLAVLVVLLLALVGPSLARIFVLDDGISDGDVVVDVEVDGIVSASNSTVSAELERQGDILPDTEDVSSGNSSEIAQTNKTIISSPISGDQNVSNVEAQDRSDNSIQKMQDRSDSNVQEAQDRRDSISWTPVTFVKDNIPVNRGHSIYTDLGMTQRPPPSQTSEINRQFYDETLQKPSTPSVYQDQGTTKLTYNDGIRVKTSYKTINPSQGEFQSSQQAQNSPLSHRGVQTFPQIEDDTKDSQRPQANFLTSQKQETAQFRTDSTRDFHFSHIPRKIPHTIRGSYIPQQSQRDIQNAHEEATNFQMKQQQQQQVREQQQQQQVREQQQQQQQQVREQQQQQVREQQQQQQQQYQQTQQQRQYQQTQQLHHQNQQQQQQQHYQQTQQQQQQQQYPQNHQQQQQQQQPVNSITPQKNTFHIFGEETQEDPRSSRSIENLRSYTSPPVRHNERQLDNNIVINAAGKSITLIPFTLEDHRDHNTLTTSNYPDQVYRQYKRQTDHMISSGNKPSTFQTAGYVTNIPVNSSLEYLNVTPSPSPMQSPSNYEHSKETNENPQPEFITDFNKGLISHDSGISPTRDVEKYTLNPYSSQTVSQTTTDPRLQQTEGFTNDTESDNGNGTRANRQFGGHPFGVRYVPTFDRHRVPYIIRPHPKTKLGYGMRVRIQPPPPNSIHHVPHGPPRDNHMSPSSNVGRYALPPNTITYGKQKPGSNGGPTTVNHPNNQGVSSNPQTNDERYLHQEFNPNVEYRPNGGYYSSPSGPPHDPNRPYKGQRPSGGFGSQLNSNKYNVRSPHTQSQQQFNKQRFPQGQNPPGGQEIQAASPTSGGRNEENQDNVNSGSTLYEQYEHPRDSSPYKKPNFGFDDGVGHASSSSVFNDKSRFPSSVRTQPNNNRYQSSQQNSQYDQHKFGFEDVSSLSSPDRNRFPGGKDNVGSSSLSNEKYSLPSAIQHKKPHYGFDDHASSSRTQDSIASQSSTASHYAFPQLTQNPKLSQAEKYSGSLRESDDTGESGEVDEYDSEEDSNSRRKLKSQRPSTYNKSNKYFMNSEITRYTTVPTHGSQPNPGSFSPASSSPGQRPLKNTPFSQHGATSPSTTRQPSEYDSASAASGTLPHGSIPYTDQRHGNGNGDSERQSSGSQGPVGNNRPPGHRPSNNSPSSIKSSNKPPPPQVSYNKSKPVQNLKPPGSKPEDQVVASSGSHGPVAVASHGAPSVSYGPPPSHVSYGPPSGGGGGGGHSKGVTGPVFTFAKTDYHGNVKWGARHKVGSQYAGHKGGGGGEYGH